MCQLRVMPGLRTLELEPELGSGFAANTFVSRVAKFAANTIALCHLVIATYRSRYGGLHVLDLFLSYWFRR